MQESFSAAVPAFDKRVIHGKPHNGSVPAVCPKCNSSETRLSRETKSGDAARAEAGEFPHRCRGCGLRFFTPAQPEAAAAAVRSRARSRRFRTLWKDRRHMLIQVGVFLVVLVLFLFCLRYLAHYHPDESPSANLAPHENTDSMFDFSHGSSS